MPFSSSEVALFGLDSDIGIHATSLDLAKKLLSLRQDLERNKNSLRTLTVSEFSRRTTLKSNLTQNAERFATNQTRSNALQPFEGTYRADLFILACVTLSETTHRFLETYDFASRFPEFCTRVVSGFSINPLLRKRLVLIVEDIFRRRNCSRGMALLEPELQSEELPLGSSTQTLSDEIVPPKRYAMQYVASRTENLKVLLGGHPLFKAMETSRQWNLEQHTDASHECTDCFITLYPASENEDITFLMRAGQTPWTQEIIDKLDYQQGSNFEHV